jgi:hypothetical protein
VSLALVAARSIRLADGQILELCWDESAGTSAHGLPRIIEYKISTRRAKNWRVSQQETIGSFATNRIRGCRPHRRHNDIQPAQHPPLGSRKLAARVFDLPQSNVPRSSSCSRLMSFVSV